VAVHIVRINLSPHTGNMRKLSPRLIIALVTLIISVSSSWLLHRLRQPRQAPVETAPCPAPTPTPSPEAVNIPDSEDNAEYPDESDLSPWDIWLFIDNNPQAKLKKLWKRLHIKDGDTVLSDFSECGNCQARLDYYDLDSESGDEALLKISDEVRESYRYLVFKRLSENRRADDKNAWRLLGHIDEWCKYRESENFIVVSGGNTWLVTMGQSANGSGVAYYHNRVFAVTRNHLQEVASYECNGYQSGWDELPTREFVTRILDIQKVQNQTRVKVEFNLNYSLEGAEDIPLFSKRQLAVFVSSNNSNQVLDPNESTVTQRELEHIYTVDSMTEHDFLKYNLSELLNLARRGNKAQKNWLKEFLERCDGSAEKRQLQAALAN
jgi:hypothetical protein